MSAYRVIGLSKDTTASADILHLQLILTVHFVPNDPKDLDTYSPQSTCPDIRHIGPDERTSAAFGPQHAPLIRDALAFGARQVHKWL